MARGNGARSVPMSWTLTPGEAGLLEAVRAVRAWCSAPESRPGLLMALVRREAERQAERPDLPRPALDLLRGALRALEAERPADPRRGRPARLALDVPLSGGRVPPAVRTEDVRAGALFDHAHLRWPDGAARRCRVLAADAAHVTWAPLRRDGTPLASHRGRREEFVWQVGTWVGTGASDG